MRVGDSVGVRACKVKFPAGLNVPEHSGVSVEFESVLIPGRIASLLSQDRYRVQFKDGRSQVFKKSDLVFPEGA